ncbi:Elongation factor G [bacterium HR39]|nr:Elongation factor G [bacterium HR39]
MQHAVVGADLAVVVIEPILERIITLAPILQFLDELEIPHILFVNKMDRSEVRFRDLVARLREISRRPVITHQYPVGRGADLVGYIDLVTEKAYAYREGAPSQEMPLPEEYRERERQARTDMLETLADFDDDLLAKLLEDERPTEEEILRDLRRTLGADLVVPVFVGVAEQDKGVRRLIEAIAREAPTPEERAEHYRIEPEGPALAQVLKTYQLPQFGKLSLVRIWRGTLREGMQMSGMRVGGVYRLFGAQQQPVEEAGAGDIVALARMEEARTGDILVAGSGEPPRTRLPRVEPAKPLYALAIRPKNRADEVKLSGALAKLVDEDPGLRVEHDAELQQTLLWGQGELHLRVALDRLEHKYRIPVETSPPKTPYRETIRKGTQAHGRHKKQTGGRGQFGDVKIEIRPLPRGAGFEFENKVVGGAVPKQFIPAVEAGAKEYLRKGPLGFPVVDVGITLFDGQYHTVDSDELSFKLAVGLALREGLPRCSPVLLEPILDVTISVPSEYTSRTLQLVNQRRGQILGYEAKPGWPGWDEVKAQIPQSEMQDLIVSLRSLSQGTGFFEWSFSHYQEVPERLQQEIVERTRTEAAGST